MLLNDVCCKISTGKKRRRVGRGIGSGCGKTSGRGHKGAGSRSGNSARLAFEGGQTAIFRRVAKRGQPKPHGRSEAKVVSVSLLSTAFESGELVDSSSLFSKSLISRADGLYKILATGNIDIPLNLRVLAISRAAASLVRACGGTVEIV